MYGTDIFVILLRLCGNLRSQIHSAKPYRKHEIHTYKKTCPAALALFRLRTAAFLFIQKEKPTGQPANCSTREA